MTDSPSKRLRLRFFPEDEKALENAQKLTTHSSKSNAIRAALVLYESVWSSRLGGFHVILRHSDRPAEDLLSVAFEGADEGEPAGKKGARVRARTEKSMEIRITRADEQRIEALRTMQAAETSSEVVRRSIRLYATVAARCRDGWEVVAVSPSGDALSLAVPGLKTAVRRAETPAETARPVFAGRDIAPRITQLSDLLPSSLAAIVGQLAARESCPIEALLVDMLRVEADVRLGIADRYATPTVSAAPTPTPAPAPSPQEDGKLRTAIENLAKAMDNMAENIDKVAQSAGDPAYAHGKQAQFTDLLFDAVSEMSGVTVPREEPTTEETWTLDNLLLRAQRLNDRLVALAELVQRRIASKGAKSSRSADKHAPKQEGVQQTLFSNGENGSKEGWGLVVARDENGSPQQRIIESETVIPLGHDDLHR